jgi:predicted phage terminase large subunit-like protein
MNLAPAEYRAFLQRDLCAFVERCFHELNPSTNFLPNWHIQVICSTLEACRRGEITRLVINMPPRSLKSLCASIAFPAFLLGHNPTAQIICASYVQDLANKLSLDCRTVVSSSWYSPLFPGTKLSPLRQAAPEFTTTKNGFRLATSVGGVLTGRGADYIIIDDPIKPEDALSATQLRSVNDWFDHTLYSRLNDKKKGCIILVMQRVHQDDLVGHVLENEGWKVLKFPSIAEEHEVHEIETPYGARRFERHVGEALHPEREPLDVLRRVREVQGEYNFAGQYQQSPAPLGGGLVKAEWFKLYDDNSRPSKFDFVFQSWDTANKPSELADYSVGTTWGVKEKSLYLMHVYRKKVGYPELKRAVREQAQAFAAQTVLIEDKASGTQLIQELTSEGMHSIKRYESSLDKIMRLHAVTSTIENGFVSLPDKAAWLGEYLLELTTFPNSKYADQTDSTSQALDWFRQYGAEPVYGVLEYFKNEKKKIQAAREANTIPDSMECPNCKGVMAQRIPGGLRCAQCGSQWSPPGAPRPYLPNRRDYFNGLHFGYGMGFRRRF